MSDLLNKASLVMIPSGYKEDVVYSAIPTDGSGDLSFTRASNGTRINSAGLVEDCPWNLLGYSEEFNNAAWDKVGTTITANATTAPNGTNTADNLIPSNGTQLSWVLQNFTSVVGSTYTISLYVKSTDYSFVQITGSTGFLSEYQNFNISTGALATGSGGTATITSVGNGWYRITYSLTCISTGTTNRFIITVQDSGTAARLASCTGNGTKFVSIWGAQLNIGSTAKPYFPTTDRLNVPRLTYQNGGGGCPSLLLEKQSTNLLLRSEEFDNAAYTQAAGVGGSITRTANYGISPDGTQNADRLQFTRGTTYAELYQRVLTTIGTTYTLSFWAKSLSGTPKLYTAWNGAYANEVTFTTDWVRYTYTFTATGISSGINFITFSSLPTTSTTADILVWGAQLEASSYATSYIPTTSASATRVADACSKTGISSLIGQTEGVLFVDVNYETIAGISMFLSIRPNATNKIEVYRDGQTIYGDILGNSVSVILSKSSSPVGRYKIALAYKSGQTALYINGTSVATSATAFSFASSLADLFVNLRSGGTLTEQAFYNEALLFPTRLNNSELVSLTTL